MKRAGIALAAMAMLAACGDSEDGAPTAAENRELDNAAAMLEELPSDSLVASDDAALGNGEAPAPSSEVLTDQPAENGAANAQ